MRTILLGLIAMVGWGQGSDTIFTQVRVANAAYRAISNIGQSQHVITVILRGACGAPPATVTAGLEASHDNGYWMRISPPEITMDLASGAPPYYGVALAFGAYPYLRVVQPVNYANCPMDVDYAGTVPVGPATRLSTTLTGHLVSSGLYGAAGRTSIVVTTGLPAGSRIVPYAITIRNAGLKLANDVVISYYAHATCGAGALTGTVLTATALQPFQVITIPPSTVPLHQGVANSALCITNSAVSNIEYRVVYRIE